MNLPPPPPPQDDNPIIAQFKPVDGQWELNDDNLKRIDPETGQTILHNYCEYINTTPIEIYEHLIQTKGCDINAQDKCIDTPLHLALACFNPDYGGDITVLTCLLNQVNINANIKGWRGSTLLHTACYNINKLPIEIFKLLIEIHGADVNAQDECYNTPLHYALRDFNPDYSGDNMTALMYLLGQKGVNANIKDKDGFTLLHVACNNINKLPLDVFKHLIETHGADVNTQDKYKDTPLHLAFRCFNRDDDGDITVLTYLINQKGINMDIKNQTGHNLLHLTCFSYYRCSEELNARFDTHLCQIAEIIAEKYVQQVLDHTTP
jgi:ankyrin repeat protein